MRFTASWIANGGKPKRISNADSTPSRAKYFLNNPGRST